MVVKGLSANFRFLWSWSASWQCACLPWPADFRLLWTCSTSLWHASVQALCLTSHLGWPAPRPSCHVNNVANSLTGSLMAITAWIISCYQLIFRDALTFLFAFEYVSRGVERSAGPKRTEHFVWKMRYIKIHIIRYYPCESKCDPTGVLNPGPKGLIGNRTQGRTVKLWPEEKRWTLWEFEHRTKKT